MAVIEFLPRHERGVKLLDALERQSEVLPFKANTRTGARTYNLEGGTDGFVSVLGSIDPDWREHLSRRP